MIKIEINTDDKKIHCNSEVHIEGTRRLAIEEFRGVLDMLYKTDKLILAMALKEFMEESFD